MNAAAEVGTEPGCPGCGYELRGLPDSASLCPECGGDISPGALRSAQEARRHAPLGARLLFITSPLWSPVFGGLAGAALDSAVVGVVVFFAGTLGSAGYVLWLGSGVPGRRNLLGACVGAVPLVAGYALLLFCLITFVLLMVNVIVRP